MSGPALILGPKKCAQGRDPQICRDGQAVREERPAEPPSELLHRSPRTQRQPETTGAAAVAVSPDDESMGEMPAVGDAGEAAQESDGAQECDAESDASAVLLPPEKRPRLAGLIQELNFIVREPVVGKIIADLDKLPEFNMPKNKSRKPPLKRIVEHRMRRSLVQAKDHQDHCRNGSQASMGPGPHGQ